jgi:cyclopropane-fatty-acyl-phospholipid synthase
LGLEDQIVIWLQDYRNLHVDHLYDAIVSVGMVEHVGRSKLELYFRQAGNLLKPGGLFMNHGISLGPIALPEMSGSFIDRYVFPDTDLLPIEQMLESAKTSYFEIRDVECLREHYATTLIHWVRNLEAHKPEALQHVTVEAYRIWWLYMAGCAYRFRRGQLSIYQTLLAKLRPDGSSKAPSTRSAWYAKESVIFP